jgi:hypothetical protein
MERFSAEYVLLAIQSALLGEVTPALRAVFVDVDSEQETFYSCFYQDGEMTEQRIEALECVVTEASADLGHCLIERRITRLDYPQLIPIRGYCAYMRREGDGSKLLSGELPQVVISEPTVAYALLAMQRTLLGAVTPELRAVVVDIDKEPLGLYVRFYCDGPISESLHHYWESVQKEAHLFFGFPCALDAQIERMDYPNPIPFRGRYAYFRWEEKVIHSVMLEGYSR